MQHWSWLFLFAISLLCLKFMFHQYKAALHTFRKNFLISTSVLLVGIYLFSTDASAIWFFCLISLLVLFGSSQSIYYNCLFFIVQSLAMLYSFFSYCLKFLHISLLWLSFYLPSSFIPTSRISYSSRYLFILW